jgi:exonuclease SbcC
VRPVKLVLEGIRSYRNKAEIDFTDLSLFALIGDTGAGKSSIIEALCLALYGGTTWSGRNVNELMSDSAKRMAVELTFIAEGETWTVTRAHRRTGGAPTHKLTSGSGHRVDGADAVNKRVQTVLGLTKDQFLRAVVMPQGRFEELLKATPGQRTDILKGIFRLQALDGVRAQVGAIAGRWKEPIARLQGERTALPPDPADAVAKATEAHRAAAERADGLEEHTRTAEAAQTAAAKADVLGEQISERASRAAEELSLVPLEAIDRIEEAGAEIARLVLDASTTQETATAAAEAADGRARTALGGFASRDDAVTGLGWLRQASESLAGLLAARATTSEALAALIAATPPSTIDAGLELVVETTRGSHDLAQAAHRDAQAAVAEAAGAYRKWSERGIQLATAREEFRAATDATDTAADAERQAESTTREAREALDAAHAARDLAVRSNAAAAAASGCTPGDDCPVCAQPLPETFTPPAADDLDTAEAAVEAATAELEERQLAAKTAANTHATAAAQRDTASTAADQAAAALEAAVAELSRQLSVPVTDDLSEGTAIAGPAAAVESTHAAAIAAADLLAEASEAASQARADLAATRSRWETERAQHSDALERATSAIGTIRDELSQLPERWRPEPEVDPAAIAALAKVVHEALDEHAAHVQTAVNQQARRASAAAKLLELDTVEATTVIQPTTELITAAGRACTAVAQLGELLGTAVAIPEVPDNDAPLADIAEAVNALSAAGTAIVQLTAAEKGRLRAEAETRTAEIEAILTATEAPTLGSLRAQAGGARSDATHANDEFARVATAAARARQIDDALGIASPFLAALDALNKLLADGKFIGHLVREREVALLTEASRVLRSLSGDRFGFGDGFKVIDRHSGQERGPDTLSGGERFQASLALALALVEIATRSGGQLEAVFVDEGFGSLDAGSLDQALTTLGAVASDGKLVALVSHLRQVAEYVDQVLLVEHDDATGSRVRPLDQTERDSLLAEDARSRMTG